MKARCRGGALIELQVVALTALLPLLFGILQIGHLLVGHHVLSFAAAEAARAGAVDHARSAAMMQGLIDGLLPLFVESDRIDDDGGPISAVLAARARAEADVRLHGRIERLTPSSADFDDHAREADGQRYIPNDALEYRDVAPRRPGGRSLQAANLLRIRVTWCHPLVVPLIDRILPALLERIDPDPADLACYAVRRVPLRVQTTAPMQSAAWP